jgi:hypothetical protein
VRYGYVRRDREVVVPAPDSARRMFGGIDALVFPVRICASSENESFLSGARSRIAQRPSRGKRTIPRIEPAAFLQRVVMRRFACRA